MTQTRAVIGESVEESIGGGEDVAPPRLGAAVGALADVFGHGRTVARHGVSFGKELAKIAVGRSTVAPAKGDRRFADPAWSTHPAYRRLEQTYLAASGAVDGVVDDVGRGIDPRRAAEAKFAADILTAALAPTNYLWTNPAALKEAFDTAGLSLVRGTRHFVSDLLENRGMPSMVDRGAFTVGTDLAVTPGAVISRDEVAEVLQYTPTTTTVRRRPVLVVPPPIGRYYFLDLRPGRSFVEYSVGRGLQTFMLSWRNPTAEQGDWDFDTYAGRVLRAIDEVREITGSDDVNLIGFCAGGILATTVLNHLAARGDDRVHSMAYAVTMLDFGDPALLGAFARPALIRFAKGRSRRKGLISARDMGSAFTWMRPNDLVFNYVVNNYLMGRTPPAFDILAWNADGTNLPGTLHGQFLDLFRDNLLVERGKFTVLGTPVDLKSITVPTFVSGAIADHLTAWRNCYRTTQLLGGDTEFVLSFSGHIASLVNPPGNPKAHYWTGGTPGPDPDAWLEHAERQQGSWWHAWADWVLAHGGEETTAPSAPGSTRHPALEAAPGRYVRDLPADRPPGSGIRPGPTGRPLTVGG
ncbi:PHA/PHB synthase family protein [Rhodococcus rhodochrous]|uniref:Poly-beta-hydroxybutyrate polymerase n=1 Tax=Rhodococcus rhodochrous KG-21 TaxID=1441923 RepID=A0A0M8PQ37_RHORH|nr:alpha/beta fold hydrolase [Rhodococcus rhodochrous]KOS57222.1 poly-beta-hydroxybutyrate polymerase [Rhodococcus rhodochrous KG-21]